MIINFKNKGLEAFFLRGSLKGIQPAHKPKLARILSVLNVAVAPQDVDLPGFQLHDLKNDLKGFWAVSVNGNWRVIFRFADTNVELVDYLDYH
jgi:plasmid maintenance system killer|nr:type II toxin-antitoxin system RelE/ParE family toxin [uncultured Ottowia sp.]